MEEIPWNIGCETSVGNNNKRVTNEIANCVFCQVHKLLERLCTFNFSTWTLVREGTAF